MEIDEKTFAIMCYLVLMNHHGQGIYEAHPEYMKEKLHILDSGFDAIHRLDGENKNNLFNWLSKFKYILPDEKINSK